MMLLEKKNRTRKILKKDLKTNFNINLTILKKINYYNNSIFNFCNKFSIITLFYFSPHKNYNNIKG